MICRSSALRGASRWKPAARTTCRSVYAARTESTVGSTRKACPLRNAKGHIDLWYLVQRDIDDQKRSEILLAGEKRLLEMVSSDNSMLEILEAICRLIENTASGCYCSVLLIDPSGARVAQGAAPSLPDSFMRSCIGTPVRIDAGPCVMAAHLNKQV